MSLVEETTRDWVGVEGMNVFALITWFVTVFAGLYLLAIWLIEYDIGAPGGAVSRLPRTVISGHVLLAASGLVVWIGYLIVDRDLLAWIALATLVAVALLGFTMLGRWILVRRAISARRCAPGRGTRSPRRALRMPAESHFPIPVVVAHGLLAVSTLTLVGLTCLGMGGS